MTVEEVNAVAVPVIYILLVMLTAAMGFRIVRHLRDGWRHTPLLLARDFLLFLYLAVSVSVVQHARSRGISLSGELWWVLLTDILVIGVLGVWNAIEFGLIRQHRSAPVEHVCAHCGEICEGP